MGVLIDRFIWSNIIIELILALDWYVCTFRKSFCKHSILSCRETAPSHPKHTEEYYWFISGHRTLRLWTKGWTDFPKSANITQVYAVYLSDSKQLTVKSNLKISRRWIFIKGSADRISSQIDSPFLNGYIKPHWFGR